ncbi:hypothetical protein OG589_01640 [Sphaerisporangium sp. NBC_01403]|uniref:hypothetical protein n=1 Tax=Sphaerisporangium sp. NBC_01403 TaxID=2903599 RepID=UPI003243D174
MFTPSKLLTTGAAVAAVTALTLTLTQAPASAAPASTTAKESVAETAARPLGNAPRCVSVWSKTGRITKTGYAKNNCGRTLRLKIIWAHGADGPCSSVRAGWTLSHKIPRGPRTFDGAHTC